MYNSIASIPRMGMHLILHGTKHLCAASSILEALPQACRLLLKLQRLG